MVLSKGGDGAASKTEVRRRADILYGVSVPSLLIESTDSMIIKGFDILSESDKPLHRLYYLVSKRRRMGVIRENG